MSEVVSRQPLPLILIRGFGGPGVEDEKRLTYQGFNQGTVYPHKRGENYIYEGLILRFMKSNWRYVDATNVVGYYDRPLPVDLDLAQRYPALAGVDGELFRNHAVLLDPAMAQRFVTDDQDPRRTLWVLRYYDLDNRRFGAYAEALVRLIDIIQALVRRHDELHPKRDEEGGKLPPPKEPVKVNLLAHSMGGLIAREAVQVVYPSRAKWLPTEKWGTPNNRTDQDFEAAKYINKIVTLGTPHQGIAFAVYRDFPDLLAGQEEFDRFSVTAQADPEKPWAWPWFEHCFPVDRLLTVVGTDYRSYGGNLAYAASRLANRLSNLGGPLGVAYNYSDGLVRIDKAQLPGAPRTFVHKCHGGMDWLAARPRIGVPMVPSCPRTRFARTAGRHRYPDVRSAPRQLPLEP